MGRAKKNATIEQKKEAVKNKNKKQVQKISNFRIDNELKEKLNKKRVDLNLTWNDFFKNILNSQEKVATPETTNIYSNFDHLGPKILYDYVCLRDLVTNMRCFCGAKIDLGPVKDLFYIGHLCSIGVFCEKGHIKT